MGTQHPVHPEQRPPQDTAPHLRLVTQGSEEPFFDLTNPDAETGFKSAVNNVFIDTSRYNSFMSRTVGLAQLTLDRFDMLSEEPEPPSYSVDEIKNLFNLADALHKKSAQDGEISILKEIIIGETEAKPTEISPVHFAKDIIRWKHMYNEPVVNGLLVRLHLVEKRHIELPPSYLQLKQQAAKPKRRPGP